MKTEEEKGGGDGGQHPCRDRYAALRVEFGFNSGLIRATAPRSPQHARARALAHPFALVYPATSSRKW